MLYILRVRLIQSYKLKKITNIISLNTPSSKCLDKKMLVVFKHNDFEWWEE